MELLGPLIVGISFPLIFIWAIYYNLRRKKRIRTGMEIISQELGLELFPGEKKFLKTNFDHLSGNYRGNSLRIIPREEKQGKHSHFFTDFILVCPTRFKLLLQAEGLFTKIGDLIGLGDTKIGDSQFDDRFRIKAEKSKQLVSLFSTEVRNSLNSLWDSNKANSKIQIQGNEIIYTEEALPGVNQLENRAKRIADTLSEISKQMNSIDWFDKTGESWWDENTEGNQIVTQ